jgi:hypothetical protein
MVTSTSLGGTLRVYDKGSEPAFIAFASPFLRLHRPNARSSGPSARRCRNAEDTDAPNGNRFVSEVGPSSFTKAGRDRFAEWMRLRR